MRGGGRGGTGARGPSTGIGLLIVATLFFASQDAITKHLMQTLTGPQIVAVRFFFFALFAVTAAGMGWGGKGGEGGGCAEGFVTRLRRAFYTRSPVLQIARGFLLSWEIVIFAYAIQFLGLAEMHTLFACFPLLVTALSVPMLGESVGWRRWLAVCCGFVGTWVVVRAGAGTGGLFQPASLIALGAALMFALYNILTRKVSKYDSFETSLLYLGLFGFVGGLVLAPFFWSPMDGVDWLWLLLVSVVAIVAHMLLIQALTLAPAAVLQPFNYFILLWAIVIGFLLHGEVLSSLELVGAGIVVGSGVFIARREYFLARRGRKGVGN